LSTSLFRSSPPVRSIIATVILGAVGAAFGDDSNGLPPGIKKVNAPDIANFYALTDRFFSGGSPDSEDAFRALAALGVKTIITVDGTKPNVELAHKYGMRYVHLPHGYDGIPAETAVKLVKAATTCAGPIFIHCHHGKHRSAAAAAVICESIAGWTPQAAEKWLKLAGTAPEYVGLYHSVRENHPPTKEQLAKVSTDFPESTEVSALVDTMVEIDQRFDHLKELVKASDTKAPSEAVLLWEQIREAQRLPEAAKHGEKFMDKLEKSEQAARTLADVLKASPADDVRMAMDRVAHSCAGCHKEYRDPDRTNRH
jgi:cytochrome c556/protein tyrosine phosphatase (PTP) superfamily phosphohydrolase (DUF442 family)